MKDKCGVDRYTARQRRAFLFLPGESIPWNVGGTRLSPPGSIPPDADRCPGRRRSRIACPPGAPAHRTKHTHTLESDFGERVSNVKRQSN